MKKKMPFIIEFVIGIAFVCIGFIIVETDYYSTLFFAMGFGLIFASCIQLFRICYYEMPINKEKYENIKRESHINAVDERKVFLRMKAGSLVYQLMTFIFLFIAFILALLHTEVWVIALIFSLFLLQTILGTLIYKRLEKKM